MEEVSAKTDEIERPAGSPPGIYGPDGAPRFFDDPGMDRFVGVVLQLASELWAHEERIRELELDSGKKPASDIDDGLSSFIERLFDPLREPNLARPYSSQ